MSTEAFDRIVKWARVINEKPNFNCTHFFLQDNEKAMIIDLSRMPEVPKVLEKLKEKEKAYLFIDLNNSKFVRYYAHDIQDGTSVFVNEVEGEILFSAVEKQILSYIEDNISEITNHKTPITRLVEMNEKDYDKNKSIIHSHPIQQSTNHSHYNRTNHNNLYGVHFGGESQQHSNVWQSTYKEREQFMDSLYAFVKQGKTASAVDLIHDFISNKKEDSEILNAVFRLISVEKLDVISLKELLIATKSMKNELGERGSIVAKFKNIVNKARPQKADYLIREIESHA